MSKSVRLILAIYFIFNICGCATNSDPTQKPPGFLPNYSLLKPVSSPKGTQIYSYLAPDAKRNNYHAAIIAPVSLYQTATESGVTAEQIEQARRYIESGVTQIASKKITITNKPGPGVARIYVSITGATLEDEGFKPRNLIPISAAIKLASKATDLDNKKPVLVIEIKMIDSQSGALLKEVVSTIDGEEFRMSIHTAAEFQQLAVKWVQQAFKYSEGK